MPTFGQDDDAALSDAFFAHARLGAPHVFRLSDGAHFVVPVPAEIQLGTSGPIGLDGKHVLYNGRLRADDAHALVRCRLQDITSP